MPLYEFKCQICSERFEELVSTERTETMRCPNCASSEVERLMSSFAFSAGTRSQAASGSGCNTCTSRSCSTCGR